MSVTRVAHLCETWHTEYPISVANSGVCRDSKPASCYRIIAFYSSTFAVDHPSIASLLCTAVDGAALDGLSQVERIRVALLKYQEDCSCSGNDLAGIECYPKSNVAI